MNESHQVLDMLSDLQTGPREAPFIIAETACSHDGDPSNLKNLIRRVSRAGPDAIQIEIFSPDHQVTPDHEMYEKIDDLAFDWATWEQIIGEMQDLEPGIFVFAYDRPSIEFALGQDIDGIKLSSSDLSNPEMIEHAALSGLPTTLSTGGSPFDEISRSIEQFVNGSESAPVLMHGVQNFPTALEDAWTNRIRLLKNTFGLPVGYQDHSDGRTELAEFIDLITLGMGVSVLEKHVSLSRSETDTDYEAALEPEEFDRYTDHIRLASSSLGSSRLRPDLDSERAYQKFQKKQIVTTQPLEKGDVITRDKVEFLRDASTNGLSPRDFDYVEGRTAAAELSAFHTITPSDFEENF